MKKLGWRWRHERATPNTTPALPGNLFAGSSHSTGGLPLFRWRSNAIMKGVPPVLRDFTLPLAGRRSFLLFPPPLSLREEWAQCERFADEYPNWRYSFQ